MTYSIFSSPDELVSKIEEHDKLHKEGKLFDKYVKFGYGTAIDDLYDITNGDNFYGKGGTKKVIEKYRESHARQAKIISSIVDTLPHLDFVKQKYKFVNRQTCGSGVDVSRYLSGDQRCWYSVKKKQQNNIAIRVYAPMGGIANISRNEMSICGSVTCSVVDALETNGVNVELWGACSCTEVLSSVDNNGIDYIRESGDHLCTLIKIKDSEQYPNIGLIDFVTGDSYFYRNIIFKDRIYTSACMLKTHGVSYRGMHGHSYNITKDILPYDESYNIDLDIIIPRIYKIEEAETWLSTTFIDMLNKITKETEE